MRKAYFLLVLFSLALVGISYGTPDHPVVKVSNSSIEVQLKKGKHPIAKPVYSSTAECLKQTFSSQVGVRETAPNQGNEVNAYLRSSGLSSGYAWCGSFVNWCHLNCSLPTPTASAWAPAWFPNSKIIWTNHSASKKTSLAITPTTSDVFGIYYKRLNRIGHVGFIEEWKPKSSYATTVEGNTNNNGSRDGDGVYRKYRLKSQIRVVARWHQA